MTINPREEQPPPQADDQPSRCANWPENHVATKEKRSNQADVEDKRSTRSINGTGLSAGMGRALGNWGTTGRLIALLVVVLAVLLLGAWLFQLTIDLGPLHLTRR